MKILCVGRNYVEHIEELNNERPEEPVIFTKPDTALLLKNAPFYYPDFSNDIHHEVELLVKICRTGKNIEEKFAHKYYDQVGVGIDFTARDIQEKAKIKGLPWAIAKGFNHSAPVSPFISKDDVNLDDLDFSLEIDGELKQKGNSKLMIFSIDTVVAYISKFFTLKKGDIIFTGTPAGVGPVKIGQRLSAFLGEKKILEVEIK